MTRFFASLVLLAACGSSNESTPDAPKGASAGTAATVGTFDGMSLNTLGTALSAVETDSKGASFEVVLTSTETCGSVTAGPTANAAFLELVLYTIDPTSKASLAPTAAGTFTTDPTSSGPFVEASVVFFDGSCATTSTSSKLTSGTVTLTTLGAGVAAGTFDLSSGSDHVVGSFDTAACPGAELLTAPAAGASCH